MLVSHSLQQVLTQLARNPQGATPVLLAEQTGDDPLQIVAALGLLETGGIVERWRFIPERYRLAFCPADDDEAAASVRLRRTAWPIMQELHSATNLPISLHQLVSGGHTVVERFPDGPQSVELAIEAERYRTPASLTAGATSLALMAFAPIQLVSRWAPTGPAAPEAMAYHNDLDRVRINLFATSAGRRVAGAGAVTAPILSSDRQPLGALCVYGELSSLQPKRMAELGPIIVTAAERLARQSASDEWGLLAPLRRLIAGP